MQLNLVTITAGQKRRIEGFGVLSLNEGGDMIKIYK